MRALKRDILSLIFMLIAFMANGQTTVYPVDLNVMLTPPFGTCLTDLTNTNRFVIQALLRDMNHGDDYKMLIQMRVKSLSSMSTVYLSHSGEFSIGMGKPTVILGSGNREISVSSFFERSHILTGAAILNGNCLPEGAYVFCFQAFDARAYLGGQRIPISREYTVTAFLENGAAPILIMPKNGDTLCNIPSINFQWQQPFVTSGINTYTLQIAESNSGFDGPQLLENGGNVLIERRGLMVPMCNVLVTEGNFQIDHTYYWRVVMCDKDGMPRVSYPNKGASPVYKFVYCGVAQETEPEEEWVQKIPTTKSIRKNLDTLHIDTVRSQGTSDCTAFWFKDPQNIREKYRGVVVEVKKKSQDTWSPFSLESQSVNDTTVELYSLAYNETYMARGQYYLYEDGNIVYAPYSDTVYFRIPHPADTADCGNPLPELTDCSGAGEKAKYEIGDEFTANGTTVMIDSITSQTVKGSSVILSGEGHLPFPILSNFGLKVRFTNVEINCADQLTKGRVVSIYDEKTAAMIDLNNMFGHGNKGNDLKKSDPTLKEVDPNDDLSSYNAGDLIVQNGEVVVMDTSGNAMSVGTLIDLSQSSVYLDNKSLKNKNIYVQFSNPDYEHIAFDDDPDKQLRKYCTVLESNYVEFGYYTIVPYVATNPGRLFQLTATPSDMLKSNGYTDIKFVMPTSGKYVELSSTQNGDGSYSVSIPGMEAGIMNEMYAIARKGEDSAYENVGKLNICCYTYKSKKLVIIPLVDNISVTADGVREALERIYGKLGYSFEVELDDEASHRENVPTSISVESTVMSEFSSDMKSVISAYKNNIGELYDKKTAYIFLMDKPTGTYSKVSGIMPQKQQFGFVFLQGSTSVSAPEHRTIAHELGHGLFGLDHLFEGSYGIPKGSTINLMDYTQKQPDDFLSYHEWSQIDQPVFSWSLFNSDEGNMVLKDAIEIVAKGTFDYIRDKAKKCTASYNTETDNLEYECESNGLGSEAQDWIVHVASATSEHFENKYDNIVKALEWIKEISDAIEECKKKGSKDEIGQCICEKLTTKGVQQLTKGFYDELDKYADNQQALESIALILANQVGKAREMNDEINKLNRTGFTIKAAKEALDRVIGGISNFICECFSRNYDGSPNLGPTNQTVVSFADTENGKEANILLRCESRISPCNNRINTINLYSTCHTKEYIESLKLLDNIKESGENIGDEIVLQQAESYEDCLPYKSGRRMDPPLNCPECIQEGFDWNNTVITTCFKKMCDTRYYLRNLPCEVNKKKCTYSLEVTSDCDATGSSFSVCKNDPAPISTTVTVKDDCSGSDLFKGTASTRDQAKVLANNARIRKGECVYGLPKCSKWIKDSDNSTVYHITSPSVCGGDNAEVEDLFTVTLGTAGVPEHGSRVMNNDVAMRNLYKVFSYECGVDSMLIEDTIPGHAGKAIMVSADQYFPKYALRIFVKVTYDWEQIRSNNGGGYLNEDHLNNAFDKLLDNWNSKNVYPNPIDYALDRPTGSAFAGPKYLINQILNSRYKDQLLEKLRTKLKAENTQIDFCNLCVTFRNIYRIVALSLAEIPYSYEGYEFMYDPNMGRPDNLSTSESYIYNGLFVSTMDVNPSIKSTRQDRTKNYTQDEADKENEKIFENIKNALSVCLATIFNNVHNASSSTISTSLRGHRFQYISDDPDAKTVPNIAVRVNGASCK